MGAGLGGVLAGSACVALAVVGTVTTGGILVHTGMSVGTGVMSERILYKVSTHLIKSPAKLGKQLKGEYSGFFKYRIGDWRVVYHLDEENSTVTITKIGHRREVYKNK